MKTEAETSSTSSNSSEFSQHNGLFPSLRYPANSAVDADDHSVSSTIRMGAMFQQNHKKKVTEFNYNGLNYSKSIEDRYDLEKEGSPRISEEHDLSVDLPQTKKFLLDSRVLEKISDRTEGSETQMNDLSESKFKFVSMYESLARETMADKESVFELSGLSDYTKFIEKSRLDNEIRNAVNHEKLAHLDNLLSVVESRDLAQNFRADPVLESENKSSKSRKKNRWKPSPDKEDYATKSEINMLLNSSSSESTGNSIFLQRKLKVRHLQMISFGGTMGVGLYLNSGKAFSIAGGFGTVLAFIIVGVLVLATLMSFCEMVTFVSVVDGVSGLSARFVDESFGFATGWLYFLSFAFGLAGEIVASVIILSYFPDLKVLVNKGLTVGFVTLFLCFCVGSNLIDVRVFGEVEYFSSAVKLIITLVIIVVMIVLNRGKIGNQGVLGFRYWDYLKSDFENNIIFGLFRPTFDLRSNGTDSESSGIGGNLGRFLSLVCAILIVTYAYSGTEIVCIAACEAQNPRKALPSATRRVFWRILIFYVLASFLVALNINSGDPRLLRYYTNKSGIPASSFNDNPAVMYVGGNYCDDQFTVYAGYANGSQSPWSVAFQSAGLCHWSSVANGFLVFFALSCGNAQLYVASRTIYSLSLQHKAPAFLKQCNRFGIPYAAVLASALISLTSYICVSELATSVFLSLTGIISSSGVIVWFSMCLSFIRFYYGLKKRPDIVNRNDKSYPYRSPFQPWLAIIGLIGTGFILLSMGFVVFLDGMWDTAFFFSSYGSLMLFAVFFFGYKLIKGSRVLSLEALDFDSGRREADIYIWDGGKEYNPHSMKDLAHKFVKFMA